MNTRTSDLVSVSYFLAIPGAQGLPGAVGDRFTNSLRDSSVQGLARLEGDRMAIEFADTAAGLESLAEAAEIMAPEVIELTFRYFDGSAWWDTWDSAAVGALPRAVEVVIGLKVPQRPRDPNDRRSVEMPTLGRSIRHVIAIPMSSPATAQGSAAAVVDTSGSGSGAGGFSSGNTGAGGGGSAGAGMGSGNAGGGGGAAGGTMGAGFGSGVAPSTRGGLR